MTSTRHVIWTNCMRKRRRPEPTSGYCFDLASVGPSTVLASYWIVNADKHELAVIGDDSTSPELESLTCHLDWDSDHPPPTNWLFHLQPRYCRQNGPFQSPLPISGTVSLHISPYHRRSRFSGRQRLKDFSLPALYCIALLCRPVHCVSKNAPTLKRYS